MSAVLFADGTKKVLVDPHPAWGSLGVAIAAAVIFGIFAIWIVVQRVRHGRDDAMTPGSRTEGDDEQR